MHPTQPETPLELVFSTLTVTNGLLCLGTETLTDHRRLYLKRVINALFRQLQTFHMYGGLSMSAPFLRREFTDSLIIFTIVRGLLSFEQLRVARSPDPPTE